MTEPSKTLNIEILGHRYQVEFPKNREFFQIENEKNRLAEGDYNAFFRNDNVGFLAKLNIDTISTFSILIPQLLKDLNVSSYMDLDLIQQNKITKAYITSFWPWYKGWLDIISEPEKIAPENVSKGDTNLEQ